MPLRRAPILLVLLALFPGRPHAAPAPPPVPLSAEDHHLREGWRLLASGRDELSREKFSRIDPPRYLLGDYALYLSGIAAARSDDAEGLEEALASLEAYPGGSPLAPLLALEAAFRRAAAGDLAEARPLLERAAGAAGNGTRRGKEGFVAARLREEADPPGAAEGHLANFLADPSGEGGQRSLERLRLAWRTGDFVRWRLPRPFLASLARGLVRAGEERDGRLLYRQALRRFPLDDGAWPVVLEFAETLRKGGDTAGARALLGLLDGAPAAVRGEATLLRARVEWRAGRLPDAKQVFRSLAGDNGVSRDTAERAAYLAAWIAEEEGDLAGAADGFASLSAAADPNARTEARFRAAWLVLLQGRAGEAASLLAAGEAEGDRYSSVEGARYRYWRGRALLEGGRRDEGLALLETVAADPGAGPYALLARPHLGREPYDLLAVPPGDGEGEGWRGERERLWKRVSSAPWDGGASRIVARASRLAALGMAEHAAFEADRLDRAALKGALGSGAGGAPLFRWLAGDLKGAMAEVDRNGPLDGELAARIRYPLAPDWIGLPDRPVNGLDPLLVHALVRQESRFQPDALSPAGALGLMQLMPKTARETARRAGRKRPERWELLRPEENVELGTRYLARLGARFGGEWMHAIAAYNGGETATDRWVERAAGDGGRFLEGITYRETRMYVRKVLLNLLQYYRVWRPGSLARTLPTPPRAAPPGGGGDGTPPPGGEASLLPAGGNGTPAP